MNDEHNTKNLNSIKSMSGRSNILINDDTRKRIVDEQFMDIIGQERAKKD